MTNNVGIEQTIGDIAELADLMDVIKNHYPDTPAVLYKLALEKSEKIAGDIRLLSSGVAPCIAEGRTEVVTSSRHETVAEIVSCLTGTEIKEEETLETAVPEEIAIPEIVEPLQDVSVTTDCEIIIEKSVVAETPATPVVYFEELLQRRLAKDIKKAISLNDRFRFRRELFGNSDGVMESTLNHLNALDSYEDTLSYLQNQFDWDKENEAVVDFMNILEKRFA